MEDAYIVNAVRTAGGKRKGRLSGIHAADLAGACLSAIADRTDIDPAAIDDVIMGCVTQAREQSCHIGPNYPDSSSAIAARANCYLIAGRTRPSTAPPLTV